MMLSRSFIALLVFTAWLMHGCAKPHQRSSQQRDGDFSSQLAHGDRAGAQGSANKAPTKSNSSSQRAKNQLQSDVPIPPGVEPEVLMRCDPEKNAKAFFSLDEAIDALAAEADLNAVPASPSPMTVNLGDEKSQTKAVQLYAKGRTAAGERRYLQAIVELQKAAELDPASPQIQRELARCFIAENRSTQAADAYEKLLQLQPDNPEALFTLGLSSASRRDFPRAAVLLGRLRSTGRDPESSPRDQTSDILADFTLTLVLRELGYDRASIQAAESAVNIPDQFAGLSPQSTRLASVYRQRGETWRAIGDAHCRLSEHEQALLAYANSAALPTADPSALHPRIVYANLCLNRPEVAQQELLHAIVEQQPTINERDIRLCAYMRDRIHATDVLAPAIHQLYREHPERSSYARAAAALSSPQEARTILKDFVNRQPRDLDGVSEMLSWLAQENAADAVDLAVMLAHDHADLADAYIDRLALAVPDPGMLLAGAKNASPSAVQVRVHTTLLAKFGGSGEAWTVIQQARERWPDDRGLMLQELRLAAAMQEPALFERSLESITGLANAQELIAVSQARRALGQTEVAVRLAEQAVEQNQENVDAMIELARAHGAHAAALASNPSTKVQARDEVDRAVQIALAAIALKPDRDEAHEVLILIYSPGGVLADTQLLAESKHQLRQSHPQSRLYARLAAQELIGQKRYEQAIERLLNLYDADSSDKSSLTMAVTAWQQWDKLDVAEQWLNDRLSQRPSDSLLTEQWARVKLMRNAGEDVVERLQKIIANNAHDIFAQRLLENVYRATGQAVAALKLGEDRLLARPQGVRREVELAALYAGAESADRAFERLEYVRQHAGDASLDDLASAIGIAGRLKNDHARADALTLDLVHETIDRYPHAPLEVYGSGLRSLAKMNRLNAHFDALADRAVAYASHGGAQQSALQGLVVWRDMAQALIDADVPAAAARTLRARLRSDAPLDNNALAFLARLIIVCDAAAEAASTSLDAQSHTSEHAEQTMQVVRMLEEKGVLRQALTTEGRSSLAEGYYEASVFYSILGCQVGAQRLLRETVALNPQNEMAMNNLGYMRLQLGHSDDETVQWIERAGERLPDEPNVIDTVGWLRYKQGKFTDEVVPANVAATAKTTLSALSLIQQSVKLDPQPGPEVLDHLGDAHWRAGENDAAVQAWQRVVALMEGSDFQPRTIQRFQAIQSQIWQLVVTDPRTMYDREYGPLLARAKQKIAAAEAGGQPAIALTFAELQQASQVIDP